MRSIALPSTARRWVVALLTLCLTVLTPAWARAHGILKSSVPAAGAHLGVAPTGLRLTFTESPELTFTTITLRAPDGSAVALGAVQVVRDSRRAVAAAIQGALAAGTYTVEWKTAGADGHPVTGRFECSATARPYHTSESIPPRLRWPPWPAYPAPPTRTVSCMCRSPRRDHGCCGRRMRVRTVAEQRTSGMSHGRRMSSTWGLHIRRK